MKKIILNINKDFFVKIIIYAAKDRYSAVLISDNRTKRVSKRINKNSEIKTLLIGLIDCIKKIKFPVELEIISNNYDLKKIMENSFNYSDSHKFIENKKLIIEFNNILLQHNYFSFTHSEEREKDHKIFNELFRDCLYKRF